MSGKDKLYRSVMHGIIPNDITYSEIKRFLENVGFYELPNSKSSHHIFKHPKSQMHINIPAHNQGDCIKRGYIYNVRQTIIMLESMEVKNNE